MKIKSFRKGLFVLCILAISSCDKNAPPANSLLWKLSKDGKTSFLFGTVHIPDRKFEKLPGPLLESISLCNTIYTEIRPDAKSQMEMSRAMILPQGRSLETEIGADLYSRLLHVSADHCPQFSSEFIGRMKVWAAVLLISFPRSSYEKSIDMLIFEQAQMMGKNCEGLESPAEQTALLDSFTADEQTEMLRDAIVEAEAGFPTIDALMNAYLAQDLNDIVRLFAEKEETFSENLKEKYEVGIITGRNRLFMERLKDPLAGGGVFIAVGAGHLIGDSGLLATFSEEGFQVEAVPFKFGQEQ